MASSQRGRWVYSSLAAFAFFALSGAIPSAQAQVWVDANQIEGKLPDWVDPQYVRPAPLRSEPPARHVTWRRIWCEPVYRTVCRRTWREPVVRVVCERVWIPERHEWREIIEHDCCGNRVVRRELVCVETGRWETRRREEIIQPGCWETQQARELVAAGHYEYKPVDEPVAVHQWK